MTDKKRPAWEWQKVLHELGLQAHSHIIDGKTTTSSSHIRLRAGDPVAYVGEKRVPASFLLEIETGIGNLQVKFSLEELEEMAKKAKDYLIKTYVIEK